MRRILKIVYVLLLFHLPKAFSMEWGVKGSWTPACNPSLKLYSDTPTIWFDNHDKATYYVQEYGSPSSTYLLLIRKDLISPTYLLAKIDILSIVGNSTQMAIRGFPEYFTPLEI